MRRSRFSQNAGVRGQVRGALRCRRALDDHRSNGTRDARLGARSGCGAGSSRSRRLSLRFSLGGAPGSTWRAASSRRTPRRNSRPSLRQFLATAEKCSRCHFTVTLAPTAMGLLRRMQAPDGDVSSRVPGARLGPGRVLAKDLGHCPQSCPRFDDRAVHANLIGGRVAEFSYGRLRMKARSSRSSWA